jgi:hypothetical protein
MQMTVLDRRRTIALLGGGLVMAALVPGALALPRNTLFNVYRKGSLIGTHAIDFAGTEDRLQVTSRLDLAVKVAFITAYRYAQTGVDVWENDVLVHTRIETNDDGAESLVVAEARGDKLAVTGPTGAYATSLGAMTDLSFWNEAITRGRPVIDSQNGELIDIEVAAGTAERLDVHGRAIEAERFAMAGTKGRSGTVWYDADGNLVKAVVLTRGETLTYELAA